MKRGARQRSAMGRPAEPVAGGPLVEISASELRSLRRRIEELEQAEVWRKRAEELLQASQAELTAVFDHAPILMMLLDAQCRVLKVNRAVVEFVNRSDETLAGTRTGDIFRCVNALAGDGCGRGRECGHCTFRQLLRDTLGTGQSRYRQDVRLSVDRAGARSEIDLLVSSVLLDIAGTKRLLVCIEDVTKWKRLEQELVSARAQDRLGEPA